MGAFGRGTARAAIAIAVAWWIVACGPAVDGVRRGGPHVPSFMDRRPAAGSDPAPVLPAVERHALSNGIAVWILPKRDLPLVEVSLLVRAGAEHGPRAGVACVTAALLDEGAGRRDALALSAEVEQLGARLDVDCDRESTAVSLRLLRRRLGRGLELLADVVRRPRLASADFVRVKARLRGWALQRRAEPAKVASLALRAALYGARPQARPLLPRPRCLDRVALADVRRFHRDWYTTERAQIVVAGDVRVASLLRALERGFGSWPARAGGRRRPATRPTSRPSSARPPRLVLVNRPGAPQAVLRAGRIVPRWRAADDAGARLLAMVLGGSFTSRLNQNLRERHGFTYGAHASLARGRRSGLLSIGAAVRSATAPAALHQIVSELRRLVARPLAASELHKAKRLLIQQISSSTETVGGLAALGTKLALFGLSKDHFARFVRRVEHSSRRPLPSTSARRFFGAAGATIVVVGDAKRLAAPLEGRFGAAVRYDRDGQPRGAGSGCR